MLNDRTSSPSRRASVAIVTTVDWPGMYLGPIDTPTRWMRTTGALTCTWPASGKSL